MANTQALCSNFKQDLLNGYHAFSTACPARSAGVADIFKAALYSSTATINATTAAYSATGEIGASGTYTTGGVPVTWISPTKTAGSTDGGSVTYSTLSANIQINSFTASDFDTLLIYNATHNKAVSVHTFGVQSIVAGTFTLTMPVNDEVTGLLRLT